MKKQSSLELLTFVTSNSVKFAEAKMVAGRYGLDLRMKSLEVAEIQDSDPNKVVQAKAKSAYQLIKRPVVVHDSSWAIPVLDGSPGVYMHDVVGWFKTNDWLNLMRYYSDRTIEVCENLAYYDEREMKCFQYCQRGVFLDSPRGINGNSLEKVVVLADNKTIAEHHDLGIENNSVSLQVWEEFFEWYRDFIS